MQIYPITMRKNRHVTLSHDPLGRGGGLTALFVI